MLSNKMEEALNGQLNAELYSAYLYLSMATYFAAEELPGFANAMRVHRLEEITHGMKFYDFIEARGGRVLLKPIEGPQTTWGSPLDAVKAVLEHERKVTGLIHDLVDLAAEDKDHATSSFLNWFVDEQVEEEETATDFVRKVERVKDSPQGLFMLDQEMGKQAFKPQPGGIEGGLG